MPVPGVAAPAAPTQLAMAAVDPAQAALLATQLADGPVSPQHPISTPNPLSSIYDTPAPVIRGWGDTPEPRLSSVRPDALPGALPERRTAIPIWLLAVAFVVTFGLGLGITVLLGSLG